MTPLPPELPVEVAHANKPSQLLPVPRSVQIDYGLSLLWLWLNPLRSKDEAQVFHFLHCKVRLSSIDLQVLAFKSLQTCLQLLPMIFTGPIGEGEDIINENLHIRKICKQF